MALQIALAAEATNVGMAAPEAYVRIGSYSFDANVGVTYVVVLIYANQAARAVGKSPLVSRGHKGAPAGTVLGGAPGSSRLLMGRSGELSLTLPSLDEINDGVRNSLYTWLKTLPEYAGAIDV